MANANGSDNAQNVSTKRRQRLKRLEKTLSLIGLLIVAGSYFTKEWLLDGEKDRLAELDSKNSDFVRDDQHADAKTQIVIVRDYVRQLLPEKRPDQEKIGGIEADNFNYRHNSNDARADRIVIFAQWVKAINDASVFRKMPGLDTDVEGIIAKCQSIKDGERDFCATATDGDDKFREYAKKLDPDNSDLLGHRESISAKYEEMREYKSSFIDCLSKGTFVLFMLGWCLTFFCRIFGLNVDATDR